MARVISEESLLFSRAVLNACFDAGVAAVQAPALLGAVRLEEILGPPLGRFKRVEVLGAGKAAAAMGAVFEERYGSIVTGGELTVPRGYHGHFEQRSRLRLTEAGHPVPDAAGAASAARALARAASLSATDLLVVLLSGGASALWSLPAGAGLTLPDLVRTNAMLLQSGLPIAAVNGVRKHLTRLSAGRLAAAAYPATTCALVLSDVEGDDLATVGSGPTVGTDVRAAECAAMLREVGVWEALPVRVQQLLRTAPTASQPPRPGDARLSRTHTVLVGNNAMACRAAAAEAERHGFASRISDVFLGGSARDAGQQVAAAALAAARTSLQPMCLVWGGETTVQVTGMGKGGRNQEVALSAALALDGAAETVSVLCAGTDGRDGPTDAAGAFAEPGLCERARDQGYDPQWHLDNHDAYPLLNATDALLITGPTHTNVMDLTLGMVLVRSHEA